MGIVHILHQQVRGVFICYMLECVYILHHQVSGVFIGPQIRQCPCVTSPGLESAYIRLARVQILYQHIFIYSISRFGEGLNTMSSCVGYVPILHLQIWGVFKYYLSRFWECSYMTSVVLGHVPILHQQVSQSFQIILPKKERKSCLLYIKMLQKLNSSFGTLKRDSISE